MYRRPARGRLSLPGMHGPVMRVGFLAMRLSCAAEPDRPGCGGDVADAGGSLAPGAAGDSGGWHGGMCRGLVLGSGVPLAVGPELQLLQDLRPHGAGCHRRNKPVCPRRSCSATCRPLAPSPNLPICRYYPFCEYIPGINLHVTGKKRGLLVDRVVVAGYPISIANAVGKNAEPRPVEATLRLNRELYTCQAHPTHQGELPGEAVPATDGRQKPGCRFVKPTTNSA
jgi:hypothetical protein